IPVSVQTVRNALKQEDMVPVVKTKQPLLKAAHRKARLAFAHKYKNWTADDWKRVLWSDETKVNKINSDCRVYVWKKKGEPLSDRTTTTTVKHGGETSWYGAVWVGRELGYFQRLKATWIGSSMWT